MIFTFSLSLSANNCTRLNNLHLLSDILTLQLLRNNAALYDTKQYCWHFKTYFYLTILFGKASFYWKLSL